GNPFHEALCVLCVVNFSVLCLFFHHPLVQKEKTGDDVTLSCQAPDGIDIIVAEWRRSDLKKEPLFLYQDGRVDSENQHPSFKNRVQLKDREMKNGDLSNVTKEDSGTYECHYIAAGEERRKRAIIKTDPMNSANDLDEPAGSDHVAAAVVPVLAVVVGFSSAVAVVMYRKQKASVEHRQVSGVCQECVVVLDPDAASAEL
uniref:Ig-like domain-containing protein n=1 Tax=Myripristis murdjan TaxID=586833 RepID=A0A668A2N4_9TELE